MGNDSSLPSRDLSKDELEQLLQTTKYTAAEIKDLHEKFRTDFPCGGITKEQFVDMYAALSPGGDSREFAYLIFTAYDADCNGEIDFFEFVTTLNIACKGTVDEKLKWAFKLYDMDGNGTVSRAETIDMVTAIYKMHGESRANEKAEETALQIFLHLDKNKDDNLSEEEFVSVSKNSPTIRNLLSAK